MIFYLLLGISFIILVIIEKKILLKKFKLNIITSNFLLFTILWIIAALLLLSGLKMADPRTMKELKKEAQWIPAINLTIFCAFITIVSFIINYLKKKKLKSMPRE